MERETFKNEIVEEERLSALVRHVNETEIAPEERLTDMAYFMSFQAC